MQELRTLVPSLNQEIVDALIDIGLRTDIDLLFSADSADIFKRLPPGSIDPHDLSRLVSEVAAQTAAPPVRGDAVLALENKRLDDTFHGDSLSSGVPDLDDLVGGFGGSRVIEITGDRGSGKTTLALQVVLRHLFNVHDSAALWIDTTGDFSVERIPMLLESSSGAAVSTALERLQVALAFEIEAADEVLESLRSSLTVDPDQLPVMRFVVIDTISTMIRPLLSATSSRGHAIMVAFMRQLRILAESFSLTVLVVNSSSNSSPRNPDSAFVTTARKPALGPSFTFLTDTTLWLSRHEAEDGNEQADCTDHVAEVFRSRTKRSKTWCSFAIRNGVICCA